MVHTGVDLLMENLKQLVYCNDNPLINNHPEILSKRPQIQVMYEQLSFIIEILFVEKQNDQQELDDTMKNLMKRFKHLVQEAHRQVGSFVYSINAESVSNNNRFGFRSSLNLVEILRSIGSFNNAMFTYLVSSTLNMNSSLETHLPRSLSAINSNYRFGYSSSLNLDDIMRSIESFIDEMVAYLDSSTLESLKTHRPRSLSAINSIGKRKVMKEMVVGFDPHVEMIRDQLCQDTKQLGIVSIVGTGGLGKTTLATILFNDPFVVYHFHVRAWVTVSQTYVKRDLLIQILTSIGIVIDHVKDTDSQLHEKLHKRLMRMRYLIVVDDIWSTQAWNDLKRFFPDESTGSRILLTTRLREVAVHANSHGFIHQLEYLTDEESWELLRKKVFHGNDHCPEWLIEPGIQIAKNCHGLPLAVVVIAGVLAKEVTKVAWDIISENTSSYIASDPNGYLDILALSYDHLHPHLKDCFLYLGRFPEDHIFGVRNLIWLWVAEGFIQESGNQSQEEIAEDYLMELVDRNLVIVSDKKFNGTIKAFSVHDLLRELCLERAKEDNFCSKTQSFLTPPRIFTDVDSFTYDFVAPYGSMVQSFLCFHRRRSIIHIPNGYFYSYPNLMVLDIQKCRLKEFPHYITLLVHLRYLAFWGSGIFPSSICNLWSLQTLIVRGINPSLFPNTISNLVNLRHLRSTMPINFQSIEKPMNLETISRVSLADGDQGWVKYIPGIKKLAAATRSDEDHDFQSLTSLETLLWTTLGLASEYERLQSNLLFPKSLMQFFVRNRIPKMQMRLPTSLKNLSLAGCCLPWSDMSIIQSLPNLEVLKILDNAFVGPRWEIGEEEQFRQLKFLKLQTLDIQEWEASSSNFPFLERLVVDGCKDLKEIPLELGNIPTLELIEVDEQNNSVVESLREIKEEQHNEGNDDLKINIRPSIRSRNIWKLGGTSCGFLDGKVFHNLYLKI